MKDGKLPRSVREGLAARARLDEHSGPVKIITLVRSAFERNLSAAFASLRAKLDAHAVRELVASEEAVAKFWDSFSESRPFQWFDTEYEDGLGINVYNRSFPAEGILAFRERNLDILILRSELPDKVKLQAVGEHVGVSLMHSSGRVNVQSHNAELKDLYASFVKRVPVDDDVIRMYLDSEYMRNFYPEMVVSGSLFWRDR